MLAISAGTLPLGLDCTGGDFFIQLLEPSSWGWIVLELDSFRILALSNSNSIQTLESRAIPEMISGNHWNNFWSPLNWLGRELSGFSIGIWKVLCSEHQDILAKASYYLFWCGIHMQTCLSSSLSETNLSQLVSSRPVLPFSAGLVSS